MIAQPSTQGGVLLPLGRHSHQDRHAACANGLCQRPVISVELEDVILDAVFRVREGSSPSPTPMFLKYAQGRGVVDKPL